MDYKYYAIREIPKENVDLRVNQQELEVKGVCKSSLFTSSSLHKHKRK